MLFITLYVFVFVFGSLLYCLFCCRLQDRNEAQTTWQLLHGICVLLGVSCRCCLMFTRYDPASQNVL
ncbi:hypothetical protein J3F83DRAFT_752578 [Trichoderma novae-zelandiae]